MRRRGDRLYDLVSELRPATVRPLVRFEGLPGEFSQHDFGQVDVRFLDGMRKRVHFVASRLKYSRWVEVPIVPDECAETLVRAGRSLRRHRGHSLAGSLRSTRDDRIYVDGRSGSLLLWKIEN